MSRSIEGFLLAASLSIASPAPAQVLPLPARSPSALTGSQIASRITSLTVEQREAFLYQEIASGNVPDFLRQLVPVTVSSAIGGRNRTATYRVTPDYLAVGSDADFFRMPMTPLLGQQVANLTGCLMPTRRMVDAIYAQAQVKLAPFFYSPAIYNILDPALFYQHHLHIESQRAGNPLGRLVGGIKKDVVVSPLIAAWPGRVVIYGWHQLNGSPIQPLSKVHIDGYADYSHGVRLVQRDLLVDGSPADLASILADPALNVLVSDEGAFTSSSYPAPPPPESFPLIDAFPASGPALQSWQYRFTPPRTIAHLPLSPGGDGYVIEIEDPAGGTDSLRLGSTGTTDCLVQADLFCEYRPALVSDGYERIGIFVRDNAQGSFDGTLSTQGACYGLTWDSDDGRLRCMRAGGGIVHDLAPVPLYRASTAWRRFRIEARGPSLTFLVDGYPILATTDTTYASGELGIGYHENFQTNAYMRGTRADNFFADLPDALATSIAVDSSSGALRLESSRGIPGDYCWRAATFASGSFPNGPFYGLDMSLSEALLLLASGHPAFLGSFDGAGRNAYAFAPPLPSGFTLHAVTLEIDPWIRLVSVSAPVSFVIP